MVNKLQLQHICLCTFVYLPARIRIFLSNCHHSPFNWTICGWQLINVHPQITHFKIYYWFDIFGVNVKGQLWQIEFAFCNKKKALSELSPFFGFSMAHAIQFISISTCRLHLEMAFTIWPTRLHTIKKKWQRTIWVNGKKWHKNRFSI